MTASATMNGYISLVNKKNEEDLVTMNKVTELLKKDNATYNNFEEEKSEAFSDEYQKVLKMTTMSMKMFSNSYCKKDAYLDYRDIEQIKTSLKNFANQNEKINEFKNALIEDLTTFQKQINEKHLRKITELAKEKNLCEKQINVLNADKHKLIMSRLSQIAWPYDEKTKEYDNKIAANEIKMKQIEQKIEYLKTMRPVANEKDILIYQMQLKEKYAIAI